MKARALLGVVAVVAVTFTLSPLARAHTPTNAGVSINAGAAYTNALGVTISTTPTHCPPGGDMSAIEVSFRNSEADAWTVVKAGDVAWPAGNCSSGTAPTTAATFAWTLASGADGARTVYARLRHGGDSALSNDAITLDTTPPVITDTGFDSGTAGSNGWYTSAVTNGFAASDTGGSGLAAPCAATWTVSSGTSEASAVTIPSGTCTDVAGNTAPSIDSAAFQIDLSDPTVTISAPVDGSTTSSATTTVSGTAADSISGVAKVEVGDVEATGTTSWSLADVALECGLNTITATVTDNAGRTGTDSVEVARTCASATYTIGNFLQPINDPAGTKMSTFKRNSTIPVKFQLRDEDGNLMSDEDAQAIADACGARISHSAVAAATTGTVEATNNVAGTSGDCFRYDAAADQFIFNLSTKNMAVATHELTATVDDVDSHSVNVSVK